MWADQLISSRRASSSLSARQRRQRCRVVRVAIGCRGFLIFLLRHHRKTWGAEVCILTPYQLCAIYRLDLPFQFNIVDGSVVVCSCAPTKSSEECDQAPGHRRLPAYAATQVRRASRQAARCELVGARKCRCKTLPWADVRKQTPEGGTFETIRKPSSDRRRGDRPHSSATLGVQNTRPFRRCAPI